MTKSEDLRELLRRDAIATAVGARDALTARIVERSGFDALWLSSFELSASRGLPDLGLLTMNDYLEVAVQIQSESRLPLLVDCDTGFGGIRNFVRAFNQFGAAGIAGVCIEDKIFPKRNSFLVGKQELEDQREFARRISAAKIEDAGHGTVLVARTEALIAGRGMAEALDRAGRYADSGADAILVHSKSSDPSQITGFMQQWRRSTPVVIVPTTYGGWALQEAADAGVSLVIYANQALRAAIQAMMGVLEEISARGEASSMSHHMASMASIFELTDVARWERLDGS
jgi:phosphoenolpyruvate phosphomutase